MLSQIAIAAAGIGIFAVGVWVGKSAPGAGFWGYAATECRNSGATPRPARGWHQDGGV